MILISARYIRGIIPITGPLPQPMIIGKVLGSYLPPTRHPLRVPLTFTITNKGLPSPDYIVRVTDPTTLEDIAIYAPNLPTTQYFLQENIYRELMVQIFDYVPPKSGVSQWPVIGIGSDNFAFEMSGSGGGGGSLPYPSGSSRVRGVAHDDIDLVAPDKIIRVYHRDSGLLLGEGTTDSKGAFNIKVPTTNSELMYLIGIDPDKKLSPPVLDYIVAEEA